MKAAWTEGLSPEDKKTTREDFSSAAALRARFVTMLNKRIDAERKSIVAKNSYDAVNWSLLQADSIGYQRALQEVINLVTS